MADNTPASLKEHCVMIADRVEPGFRVTASHSCTGHYAKRWQAAYDGASIALTDPSAIGRSLSDQAFYAFIAMDREAQKTFADRLNSFHAELGHSQSLRWMLTATDGSAPTTKGCAE